MESGEVQVIVRIHQGSIVSPFLFIIVLETFLHKFRTLPCELLYATDLILIAESLEETKLKFARWKVGMESKRLGVNVPKIKVVISCVGEGPVVESGK